MMGMDFLEEDSLEIALKTCSTDEASARRMTAELPEGSRCRVKVCGRRIVSRSAEPPSDSECFRFFEWAWSRREAEAGTAASRSC